MPVTPAMKERAQKVLAELELVIGGVRDTEETHPLSHLALTTICRGLGTKRARAAVRRLESDYVDWNDVRVTPVRELAAKVGGEDSIARAERLVELLAMVFLRFNRLSLEWLSDPAKDTGGRKMDRLVKWLGDRSLAHVVSLKSWVARSPEVVVDGGFPKVLQRLGLSDGKGAATALKLHVRGLVPESDLMALLSIIHTLAETTCVSPKPECTTCVARSFCPSSHAPAPAKEAAPKLAKSSSAKASKTEKASTQKVAVKGTKQKAPPSNADKTPARAKASPRKS